MRGDALRLCLCRLYFHNHHVAALPGTRGRGCWQRAKTERRVVAGMAERVRQKRICLKDHFVALDPRGEGAVRDDVAMDLLHM